MQFSNTHMNVSLHIGFLFDSHVMCGPLEQCPLVIHTESSYNARCVVCGHILDANIYVGAVNSHIGEYSAHISEWAPPNG